MNLLTQLGIFSQRKKKQFIYTIILIVAIIAIIFIWFPQMIPYRKLITFRSQASLQEQYRYRKAVQNLNMINKFLNNDLSLIKNLNCINTSNQFRLPVSHGRSNPFLP